MKNTHITLEVEAGHLQALRDLYEFLDPDTGGAKTPIPLDNGRWIASMPASPERIAMFAALQADPASAVAIIASDVRSVGRKTLPDMGMSSMLLSATVDMTSIDGIRADRNVRIKGQDVPV